MGAEELSPGPVPEAPRLAQRHDGEARAEALKVIHVLRPYVEQVFIARLIAIKRGNERPEERLRAPGLPGGKRSADQADLHRFLTCAASPRPRRAAGSGAAACGRARTPAAPAACTEP